MFIPEPESNWRSDGLSALADPKANAGWVSGIVSKAASQEVRTASLTDTRQVAHEHTANSEAEQKPQQQEEQLIQPREQQQSNEDSQQQQQQQLRRPHLQHEQHEKQQEEPLPRGVPARRPEPTEPQRDAHPMADEEHAERTQQQQHAEREHYLEQERIRPDRFLEHHPGAEHHERHPAGRSQGARDEQHASQEDREAVFRLRSEQLQAVPHPDMTDSFEARSRRERDPRPQSMPRALPAAERHEDPAGTRQEVPPAEEGHELQHRPRAEVDHRQAGQVREPAAAFEDRPSPQISDHHDAQQRHHSAVAHQQRPAEIDTPASAHDTKAPLKVQASHGHALQPTVASEPAQSHERLAGQDAAAAAGEPGQGTDGRSDLLHKTDVVDPHANQQKPALQPAHGVPHADEQKHMLQPDKEHQPSKAAEPTAAKMPQGTPEQLVARRSATAHLSHPELEPQSTLGQQPAPVSKPVPSTQADEPQRALQQPQLPTPEPTRGNGAPRVPSQRNSLSSTDHDQAQPARPSQQPSQQAPEHTTQAEKKPDSPTPSQPVNKPQVVKEPAPKPAQAHQEQLPQAAAQPDAPLVVKSPVQAQKDNASPVKAVVVDPSKQPSSTHAAKDAATPAPVVQQQDSQPSDHQPAQQPAGASMGPMAVAAEPRPAAQQQKQPQEPVEQQHVKAELEGFSITGPTARRRRPSGGLVAQQVNASNPQQAQSARSAEPSTQQPPVMATLMQKSLNEPYNDAAPQQTAQAAGSSTDSIKASITAAQSYNPTYSGSDSGIQVLMPPAPSLAPAHPEIAPADSAGASNVHTISFSTPGAASAPAADDNDTDGTALEPVHTLDNSAGDRSSEDAASDAAAARSGAGAEEAVDKRPFWASWARPIAVEKDQSRVLPPKKAVKSAAGDSTLNCASILLASAAAWLLMQLLLH